MDCIKMFDKTTRTDVDVYKFSDDGKTALCWSRASAGQQNGNGWTTISRKRLIPYPDAEKHKLGIPTQTELNKIKSYLKPIGWETTDGLHYTHAEINNAIEHQKSLLEKI